MLTNAYYYNFYRPYIVGKKERANVVSKRPRIAQTSHQDKIDKGMRVVLNKSRKAEIVNYAKNVSHGVTQLKSVVRTTLTNMNSFGLNAMYRGYDSAVALVEKDLTKLAEAYNAGTEFMEAQDQSEELRSFSEALRERISQGRDKLRLLGLTVDRQRARLQFDPDVLKQLSQIELHAAIGINMQVFHSMHRSATDVLNAPMASHISFKGLSYHYNYQLGRIVEDGYGIIESGMVIDRVV